MCYKECRINCLCCRSCCLPTIINLLENILHFKTSYGLFSGNDQMVSQNSRKRAPQTGLQGIYCKRHCCKYSKTSFEKKTCFSAWASTLNMGLINKVDMVCLSPVGYGV